MVDHIIITDGADYVHLLPGIEFTITPVEVSVVATMASGREVRDWTGYKYALEIPTGWLAAENLATLNRMIRETHVLTTTYPTPEGERTSLFSYTLPPLKAFKYGPDGSIWYGVTITATEYEVRT